MTTNFTLRDFFGFLLTGLILVGAICLIFYDNVLEGIANTFTKYPSLKDISFIITLFILPIIYLFGHIIGSLSYRCLKLYIFISKFLENRKKDKGQHLPSYQYYILIFFQITLYQQRIVYAIIQQVKSEKNKCEKKDIEDFWTICALLQIEKKYSSAEYWNLLNEFFNSLNLIFFISMIIAFYSGNLVIGIIYSILMVLTYYRAKQYADYFIKTVKRLVKAQLIIDPDLDI
ncbi:hypothetical protein [Dysgonomonas sp.]|uniref:hypothetical protein n=1 Tax=Dysgonomonas sp. TaxID=1891233 RepID=UPI0027BB1074|nr:hypothetical protein [Dysgonomonas sp.]